MIDASAMPGGDAKPFNQGKTSVHEIGHWMGLDHIGTGGCDDTVGDAVADTKPQKDHWKCPVLEKNLDTCPDREGRDSKSSSFRRLPSLGYAG